MHISNNFFIKGTSSVNRDIRPFYEGYSYKEGVFCAENTYDHNATTIAEAISRCSNDPECSAVEDRWGSGKPPIGLCKRFKGKRSGAGTYLLRRGISQ